MAFTAPTLFHPITPGDYVTEVNANFSLIQSALNSIESELISQGGGSIGAGTNFGWLQSMTKPDGVIGVESWVPRFSTDHQTLYIDVPAKGFNDAVILGSRRSNDSEWTVNLVDRVSGLGDGTHRIAIQLKAQGAGLCELLVEQADGATDETGDLTLYEFDYVVSGSGTSYTVTNFRRVTHILASSYLIDDLVEQILPLTFHEDGNPFANSEQSDAAGVHAPFDLEIVSVYATLHTVPTGNCTFKFVKGVGTNAVDLTGTITFTAADDTLETKSAAGLADNHVLEGEFISKWVTATNAVADGLSVTLMCRRLHHQVY